MQCSKIFHQRFKNGGFLTYLARTRAHETKHNLKAVALVQRASAPGIASFSATKTCRA